MIMPQGMFFAPSLAECGHALQIADHARAVVNIGRAARAARGERALVYVFTLVANGDFHVGAEIIAACLAAMSSKARKPDCGKASSKFKCNAEPPSSQSINSAPVQQEFV